MSKQTNLDVFPDDVLPARDARRDGGGREELDGVAERRLGTDLAQHVQGVIVNLRRVEEKEEFNECECGGNSKMRYTYYPTKRFEEAFNAYPTFRENPCIVK